MSGDNGETGAVLAVGQRYSGVIRRGKNGGYAGHNFKGNVRRGQFLGLLTAASEDVRVATLEAHDGFAFVGLGDQQLVQLVLRNGVVFGSLAAKNDFGGPGSETQQVRVHQRVIDHNVGATEQLRSAQREQADVAGPGAHQIDHAFCSLHSLPVYALATIPATTQTKRVEPILARNGICPPSTYQDDSPVVRKRPNTDFTPNLNPVIAQSRPLRIQYTTPATEQTLNEESLMPVIVNKNFFTQCL